jgi:uncharacterized protein YoxC
MEKTGLVQFDWTMLFQIANTLILVAVIYGVIRFLSSLKRRRDNSAKQLDSIEKKVDELLRESKSHK